MNSVSISTWVAYAFRMAVAVLLAVSIAGYVSTVGAWIWCLLAVVVYALVQTPVRGLLRAWLTAVHQGVPLASAVALRLLLAEWDRIAVGSGIGTVERPRQGQDDLDVESNTPWLDLVRYGLVVAGLASRKPAAAYRDVPRVIGWSVWSSGVSLRLRATAVGVDSVDLASTDTVRHVQENVRLLLGDAVKVRGRPEASSLVLDVLFSDPLKEGVAFPTEALTAGVDLDRPLDIGRAENGSAFGLTVFGRQTLLVGASGSGKGSIVWSLLLRLAPAIRDGRVRVHGIDLKGGVEFNAGEGFFDSLAYSYEDAEQLIAGMVDRLEERLEVMREAGSRKHQATPAEPYELLVVDEAASLSYLAPDTKTAKAVDSNLRRLLSTGRAAGFAVFSALQDPRKEALQSRDLYTQTVALRLRSADDARLALGSSIYEAGAQCEQIPQDQPGTGYAINSETGEVQRFRAFWCSDAVIGQFAGEYGTRGGVREP